MADSYISFIAGTAGIIGQDVWATIDEQLHEHSPEIGQTLQEAVRGLTPILSGSLFADISYEAYPDPGDPDLVWIYPEEVEQEAYWNRVYVQYQEGGPMGEHTYTNDPRLMFFDTGTIYGPPMVEAWAEIYINEALLLCSAGAGIPM